MAHEAYLLDRGTISHHGPANQLNPNDLMQHYTGTTHTTNTTTRRSRIGNGDIDFQ
jgi:hypothetical protein